MATGPDSPGWWLPRGASAVRCVCVVTRGLAVCVCKVSLLACGSFSIGHTTSRNIDMFPRPQPCKHPSQLSAGLGIMSNLYFHHQQAVSASSSSPTSFARVSDAPHFLCDAQPGAHRSWPRLAREPRPVLRSSCDTGSLRSPPTNSLRRVLHQGRRRPRPQEVWAHVHSHVGKAV